MLVMLRDYSICTFRGTNKIIITEQRSSFCIMELKKRFVLEAFQKNCEIVPDPNISPVFNYVFNLPIVPLSQFTHLSSLLNPF